MMKYNKMSHKVIFMYKFKSLDCVIHSEFYTFLNEFLLKFNSIGFVVI